MFGFLKKKKSVPELPAVTSLLPDPEMRADQLRAGIDQMVARITNDARRR